MSFGVKKSLKLCRQYGCIARFCISCNAKPCLNPPKTRHTSQEIVNNVPYFGTVHNSWGSKVQYSEILVRRVCSISKGGLRDDEVVDDLEESSGSEAEEEPQTLKKKHGNMNDEGFVRNVDSILCILKGVEGLSPEARLALEKSGVFVSSDLVEEVLARVRNDWKSAYTVFLWAGSQQGYKHNLRVYHTMIAILGKLKQFNLAWGLIREMKDKGMVTHQTLLIMMRRYSAAGDVGRAVRTFHGLEKFKLKVDINAFQGLLGALCRYNNVEDAEKLLYLNKNVFDYETKSFNIVLNGWCNLIISVVEAKRFWKVMMNNSITPDAFSYSSMICCFSKAGNLHDVLKFFDDMKNRGCAPDLKVYNSVVYALAKGKCVKEAYNLLNVMTEKGFTPNAVTYNSLIKPLCKALRVKDADKVFSEMLQKGHAPSIRTFHAFFNVLRDSKEILKLLERMIESKCNPTIETFIMLIRKFCRWRQYENVFKLWNDMEKHRLNPDRSAYTVLIHGLFLNSKVEEAYRYYEEMKAKGFSPEPKTDEIFKVWIAGKESAASQLSKLKMKEVQKSSEVRKVENISGSSMPKQTKDRQFNKGNNFFVSQKQQNKGQFNGKEKDMASKGRQFNKGRSLFLSQKHQN